jgi:hypothetical protein
MHRSGTSLVARLALRAGAELGDPAGFHPADQWNPEGYFEQRDVLALNRRIMEGPWGKLAYVLTPSPATILRRGRRYAAELAEAAHRYQGRTIKDPRFNYTGPAWEEHGLRIERAVVCLRDPYEVAQSLRRRNRLPLRLGLEAWRDCLQRLLDSSAGRSLWVVDYAALTSPDTCVAEAGGFIRFLGLPFDEMRDASWVLGIAKPTVRPAPTRAYPRSVARVWHDFQGRIAMQAPPRSIAASP